MFKSLLTLLTLCLVTTFAFAQTQYELRTATILFKRSTLQDNMYEFGQALAQFEAGCGVPVSSVVQPASISNLSLYQLYALIPQAEATSAACTTSFESNLGKYVSVQVGLRTVTPYDIAACTVPNQDGVPTTMKCASASQGLCGGLLCYLGASCETTTQCQIGLCENHICFNASHNVFSGVFIALIVALAVFVGA